MVYFLRDVERVKRFVNVHLHCIISNLKFISKILTLLPLEKFLRTPMVVSSTCIISAVLYSEPPDMLQLVRHRRGGGGQR